jgi:curved DNA-binding protein
MIDHYKVLGISHEATPEDIKRAYRKLVKLHHPDVNNGNDTEFKKIAQAYDAITCGEGKTKGYTKTEYKSTSDKQYNWTDFFSNDDFSQMFNNAYGGGVTKGTDIKVSISISLEECYYGALRHIDVGTGGFNINIPKGIPNGTKLKVSGKGALPTNGISSTPGDIILTVNVIHDLDIIVNGNDIHIDLQLDWIDLILGGDFEIKNKLQNVIIKVPRGSYDSKLLRIVGKGMPIYNNEGFGNLFVKLRTRNIILNDRQIELLNKIKYDI